MSRAVGSRFFSIAMFDYRWHLGLRVGHFFLSPQRPYDPQLKVARVYTPAVALKHEHNQPLQTEVLTTRAVSHAGKSIQ